MKKKRIIIALILFAFGVVFLTTVFVLSRRCWWAERSCTVRKVLTEAYFVIFICVLLFMEQKWAFIISIIILFLCMYILVCVYVRVSVLLFSTTNDIFYYFKIYTSCFAYFLLFVFLFHSQAQRPPVLFLGLLIRNWMIYWLIDYVTTKQMRCQ